MTSAVLLDTHALLWLGNGAFLQPEAVLAITRARAANLLFVSHITLWEIGVAAEKKRAGSRPDLGGLAPDLWFQTTVTKVGATALPISAEVAIETAKVPAAYGFGDPGDCFLIATARIHNLTLLTRDARIIELPQNKPNYLSIIPC